MSEKQDLRVVKTKQRIFDAFISLLNEKNISQITVTELARRAQIQRKTFYLHYQSIDSLVNVLEKNISDDIADALEATDQFTAESFMENLNKLLTKNYDYYRKLFQIHDDSFLFGKCRDVLAGELSRYFLKREIIDDSEVEVYSKFIASGIAGVYVDWFNSPETIQIEESTVTLNKIINAIMNK